ncbi:N-acetylneuraminate lyase [Xanthobacteraceae bacterium Astr-EGSB]|uniref:N-acetylneuraminate lyase n=1 Tax=Astrobacterium formosum TaxID=3069710 RepID=UPI0027B6939C|nr:N-acetylneuraminate lyase [Xanthobacteraceae bacterium Astr-EGSB]
MTTRTPRPVRLAGLHAALMTPYDEAGEISKPCLARLVERALGHGLDGIYVGGSTGESLLLSVTERELVFREVAQAAAGRGALIGHVGAIATRDAERLARCCAASGYHAVSAIPPIYFRHSVSAVRDYYSAIVQAAGGLPLIIYNVPAMTGIQFSLADLKGLLSLPGVAGVKQTVVDMYQMEQLRRAYPDLLLLNGFDEMLLAGLVSGANGGIGSTYGIMGHRWVEMRRRLEAGDVRGAFEMQSRCNQVIDLLVELGVFPALKYLLARLGVIRTPLCRKPMASLGPAVERLDEVARELAREC